MLLLLGCAPEPEPAETCKAGPAPEPADLDADGWPDLVFAQTEDTTGAYRTTSPVLYGPDFERRVDLPTIGADDVAIGDLNGDAWLDLVFASVGDGDARAVDSLVYLGGPDGFGDALTLPGVGAAAVTLDDIDGDGFTDVFLANRWSGEGMSLEGYTLDSTIYWGSASGPSATNATPIETVGAAEGRFADLDQDGWVDLVVASGTFFTDVSRVYWGGPDGFDPADVLELPTAAPEGVTLADWNGDGWTDIFFANFYEDLELDIDSPLYWGGPEGFDDEAVTWIPTHGATDALAEDLDGDGCPELVVANAMTGDFAELEFEVDGEVWGGSLDGPTTVTARLPATSAAALAAADLDGDGDTDLVFADRYDSEGAVTASSTIFWNDDGFEQTLDLATVGAAGVAAGVER